MSKLDANETAADASKLLTLKSEITGVAEERTSTERGISLSNCDA